MIGKRQARPRRRSPGPRISLAGYLQSRKATVTYSLLFVAGLTLGSFYACVDGQGTMVLTAIVVNAVKLRQTTPFLQVFFQCATQSLGILVYLYFAAYCMKGKWLIYLTPLVLGLSVGTTATAILYRFLWGGVSYVLVCIMLPKFIEFLLLLVFCNNCLRISADVGSGNPIKGDVFWIFAIMLLGYALFEGILLFRFCGLLNIGA